MFSYCNIHEYSRADKLIIKVKIAKVHSAASWGLGAQLCAVG